MRALWLVLAALTVLVLASHAMAADSSPGGGDDTAKQEIDESIVLGGEGFSVLAGCLGTALIVFGGTRGIGQIGGKAVEAIARQPEAAAQMFLAWLLPAAMIEGATLFGVVVCLMVIV